MTSSPDRFPSAPVLLCRICHKPVAIEGARTDSDGRPVHGRCYAFEINSSTAGLEEKKRPWIDIADEVCSEPDPKRIVDLASELMEALDEQLPRRASSTKDGRGTGNKI